MKIFILLLSLGLVFQLGCKSGASEVQNITNNSWPNGVAYEIFVQSFYDSDGDSIGDIPGLTKKLDYIQELGADAIWLMPIMPSPSYHKYDVVDYYDIHPDYGTMEDFKKFLSEAHQREIKVIIDLVVNHTGRDHPWFIDSKSSPDSRYRDFYVWADKDSIAAEIAKKETSFDSDNITQWHPLDGDTTAEHYYGFFWGGMPDLNFDNPEVRNEIYKIGRYWLEEIGVDGFRLDAAKHIYPDDRAKDNHDFWKEFKAEMQTVNPDVYLVGEIWADAKTTAPYAAGFSAFFNFDLAFNILESINRGKVVNSTIAGHGWDVGEGTSFIDKLISNRNNYKSINPDYHDAVFLSNHDQNRVMSVLKEDPEKAKIAASILLTLPGTPYIYYGEEIGMTGMKPDERIREPFFWSESDTIGRANWIKAEYNTSEKIASLEEQKNDPESIFNHYVALIEMRKSSSALTSGELLNSGLTDPRVVSFIRKNEDQELLIVHNISSEQIKIAVEQNYGSITASFNGDSEVKKGELLLPPYSTAILSSE